MQNVFFFLHIGNVVDEKKITKKKLTFSFKSPVTIYVTLLNKSSFNCRLFKIDDKSHILFVIERFL